MRQGLSVDQILSIASIKEFVVDKYSDRDRTVRKKCRRLAKDGKLRLKYSGKDFFIYIAAKESK